MAALSSLSLVGVAGCGSGEGERAEVGAVALSVRFPNPPGVVQSSGLPHATHSVRFSVVTVTDGIPLVPDVVVSRHAGQQTVRVTIRDVPSGPAMLRARAYASTDGTGAVIAQAEAPIRVIAGETTAVRLTADRLPVRIVLSGPTWVERTEVVNYVATAYDADDEVVLGVSFGGWLSTQTSVMTIAQTGQATAQAAGSTRLLVEGAYQGSVWSGSLDVTVFERVPGSVRVTPRAMTIPVFRREPIMAEALDASGALIPYATITWASADESVARIELPALPPEPPAASSLAVSGISGAFVVAEGPGQTEITATARTGAGHARGVCVVTVQQPAP